MGYPFRARLEHEPRGNVAVIQMKDLDETNLLRIEGVTQVSLPKGKDHHLLHAGDLLFRSRGRSNGAALVPDGVGPAVLAAPMLLIRPHAVRPDYLCWFVNAPTTQTQFASLAEGTSVRMISAEALKTLEVPVPDEARQHAIARTAAIAQQEQVLVAEIAGLRRRLTAHRLMKFAHEAAR
jgi:hypothetical protein